MKVILNQDVKGHGKKGQMVEVSDGYGRNYLLPRGLAKEATKDNINVMEGQAASAKFHEEQALLAAKETAAKIGEVTVVLTAKAGENGKLFGSITSKDVADGLTMQHHIKIDKKKFVLPDGIKTLGVQTIDIKIHPGVVGKLKVQVNPQ